MSNKVAIIGAGHVGATIAYTLTVTGVAAEIVLIDINEKKAFGEAMDIRQGTAYCSPTNIYSWHLCRRKGRRHRHHHLGCCEKGRPVPS